VLVNDVAQVKWQGLLTSVLARADRMRSCSRWSVHVLLGNLLGTLCESQETEGILVKDPWWSLHTTVGMRCTQESAACTC
jgi:hypothetical protein